MNTTYESEDQSVLNDELEETKDEEEVESQSEDDENNLFFGDDEETKIVSKIKFSKYNP